MQFWTRISLASMVVASISGSSAWACLVPDAAGGLKACAPCEPESTMSDLGLASPEGEAFGGGPASAGLSGGLPGGESVVTVHVLNFDYSVNAVGPIVDPVINVGDTVHWVFDTTFHSVTSVAGSTQPFDSGVIVAGGATFDKVFTQAGSFPYFCSIHGFDNGDGTASAMSGVITVRAVPEPLGIAALAIPVAMRRRR